MNAPRVSIVLPTLNEAAALPATLDALARLDPPPFETVLADGGSTDGTLALAAGRVTRAVRSPPGRARQQNAGAAAATGDLLCFLHADTRPPPHYLAAVAAALADPRVGLVGGRAVLCGPGGVSRLTTLHHRAKTHYAPLLYDPRRYARHGLRLLFGDQAPCCRAADFAAVGGFDERLRACEDVDLVVRLNRGLGPGRGRVRELPCRVETSDRRVRRWGVVRANLTFAAVAAGWAAGAPPGLLGRWYPDVR